MEDGLTTDPKTLMNGLLDEIETLEDDIALKKAEIKVANKRFERYTRRYPEIAKGLLAARSEPEAEEKPEKPSKKA